MASWELARAIWWNEAIEPDEAMESWLAREKPDLRRLDQLLAEGWEPFAVSDCWPWAEYLARTYHLRRKDDG